MTFENFFSRKLLEHSTMDLRLFPRDSFDEASRGQSWIWSLRALKTIGLVRLTHCALFHSRWEAADVTHYRFVTVSYRHGLSAGSNPFRLGSTMTTALVCSFVQILPIEDPSSGAKPPIEGLTFAHRNYSVIRPDVTDRRPIHRRETADRWLYQHDRHDFSLRP